MTKQRGQASLICFSGGFPVTDWLDVRPVRVRGRAETGGCAAGSAINSAGDTWKNLASLATFAVLRGFVLRHQEREDFEQFTLGLGQFRPPTHKLGNLTANLLVLAPRANRARQVVQKQRFVCGLERGSHVAPFKSIVNALVPPGAQG